MTVVANLEDLVRAVNSDEGLRERLRTEPAAVLSELAASRPAYHADRWIYRIVVLILGLVVLTTLAMTIVHYFQSANGTTMPDLLISLGSAALGALAGLLAPNPR